MTSPEKPGGSQTASFLTDWLTALGSQWKAGQCACLPSCQPVVPSRARALAEQGRAKITRKRRNASNRTSTERGRR